MLIRILGGIVLKRFSKILGIFFIVSVVIFSFSFADTPINIDTTATDEAVTTIETGVEVVGSTVNSLAYTIVEQISDKSLPVCAILILWGAVLYFILGIRNLYKKRQGLLLMWGAFTFVVIAKIVNFVFWFAFIR